MANSDDDFIVDIPTDAIDIGGNKDAAAAPAKAPKEENPGKPSGVRVSALAKQDTGKAEADRIAALQRDLDQERERAAAAEAAALAAHDARVKAEGTASKRTEEAMRAHWAKIHSEHSQITGAIAQTQSEADIAQKELIAATEAGDAQRAASAQRAIAKAEAALLQLENGRIAAESEIAHTKRIYEGYQPAKIDAEPPPRTEPKRAPTPDEWIDSTRSAIGDEGANWLRTNKEFATDPKLNRKLLRFADDYADDHGREALKSPEFIAALNEKFFPSSGEDEGEVVEDRRAKERAEVEEAPKPQRQTRTAPAAPVSRGNNFFSSRNPNATQVRLPPRLAAFVKASGLNPTEYALSAVAEIKAGRLPKDYLDPDYDHGI